jgi:hypothetical protein
MGGKINKDVLSIVVCCKGVSIYSISTETENESDAANVLVGVSSTIWVLFKSNDAAVIDFRPL